MYHVCLSCIVVANNEVIFFSACAQNIVHAFGVEHHSNWLLSLYWMSRKPNFVGNVLAGIGD